MLPLPELTPENSAFWTGGERGALMITFCNACGRAIHPPQLVCPACLSRDVSARKVTGTGTVYTYTVNHQQWMPELEVPYAIAVVDVDEAAGVRVTAPVRGNANEVSIGQRMKIGFEHVEDVWLPRWSPLAKEPA